MATEPRENDNREIDISKVKSRTPAQREELKQKYENLRKKIVEKQNKN